MPSTWGYHTHTQTHAHTHTRIHAVTHTHTHTHEHTRTHTQLRFTKMAHLRLSMQHICMKLAQQQHSYPSEYNRNIHVYVHALLHIYCIHSSISYLYHDMHACLRASIYDVHTKGVRGWGSCGRMWTGGGWSSPMWTSTQKIKIGVHWRHTVFFSCKVVGVFFYQNFVFGPEMWTFFCDIN